MKPPRRSLNQAPKSLISVLLLLGLGGPGYSQLHDFNAIGGVDSSTDGALDGWIVADQYGGNSYTGYVGELALIFATPTGATEAPRGTFFGDAGGTYGGDLGLVVFCLDSGTGFMNSATPGETFEYQAHGLGAAEARFLAEGVGEYRSGGLQRASYLMSRYYDTAHGGGNLEASALQAAIWEVLTDATPSLVSGSGNYFVRSDTGGTTLDDRSADIVALTDQWFAESDADNWGGSDFNPDGEVIFWLDPANVGFNQTVISLNPEGMNLAHVPEPGGLALGLTGALCLLRRRRVVHGDGIEPPTNRV